MDCFKIIWQPIAKFQLVETLEYFSNRNGNNVYSQKLLLSIKATTGILSTFPLLGKPTDFEIIRELIHLDYSIFYVVAVNEIHIVMFWDNRRSPKLLEKELEKLL